MDSESRILKKYYKTKILKKKERFDQYLKKSKNGFPIVFSNLAPPMGGCNFGDAIWVILSF